MLEIEKGVDTNVATYEISANVKRIDEYAFANSTSLVSVKIPDAAAVLLLSRLQTNVQPQVRTN